MSTSQPNAFQVTRLIVVALAGGVIAVWGMAWILTDGGASGVAADALPGELALIVWAAAALPGFGGALYFRNRAAGGAVGRAPSTSESERGRRTTPESTTVSLTQAQTNTIIAHALLEGPALLGGVLFLLLGLSPVVWIALPVYALGAALTWPRPGWFGT